MKNAHVENFTEKESQINPLLLEGKSTKQIALQLGVSTRAIEHHLTNIYKKLGACSRLEAILKLFQIHEK
jgi:DNA-binding NarL/FixJ family response regulator